MDIKHTLLLRAISVLKAPLVFFLGAVVEELNDKSCTIRIPFRLRSKNPAGGMFLGALTTGADVAGSAAAYVAIRDSGASVSVLFKDMKAAFLKKATSDVYFSCEEVAQIRELVDRTIKTGEAVELPVNVKATVRGKSDPVATFAMTLSMKRRSGKK